MRPGQENLIPNTERSAEQVRKNQSKGGINSGKVRREKKSTKKIIEAIFESKAPDEAIKKIQSKFPDVKIKNIEDIINMAVAGQAVGGNIQAYNALYDRKDGKPKQPLTGGDENDTPINVILNNIENRPKTTK